MKLKHIRKVTFDPILHIYECGGKELIGVTGLLKKHGLSPSEYAKIDQRVLENAAERGTQFHSILEDYDNGKDILSPVIVTNLDGDTFDYTGAFKEYCKLGLNVVESEYLVSDCKTVATFIDKVVWVSETEVYIDDVKTTQKIHTESVSWQCSIGAYLFERQNPGIKVVGIHCIHTRDAHTKYVELPRVPDEKIEALLKAEAQGVIYSIHEDAPEATIAIGEKELAEFKDLTLQMAAMKATMDALSAKKEQITSRLLDYMQENHLPEMSSEFGTFSVKAGYTRTSIDSTRLKKEHPEIAEKYSKTTEVAPSLTFKAK